MPTCVKFVSWSLRAPKRRTRKRRTCSPRRRTASMHVVITPVAPLRAKDVVDTRSINRGRKGRSGTSDLRKKEIPLPRKETPAEGRKNGERRNAEPEDSRFADARGDLPQGATENTPPASSSPYAETRPDNPRSKAPTSPRRSKRSAAKERVETHTARRLNAAILRIRILIPNGR